MRLIDNSDERARQLHEADLISIESPLGKALLGHKVGDRVYIKVNEQFGYYVEIRSISAGCRARMRIEIRKF